MCNKDGNFRTEPAPNTSESSSSHPIHTNIVHHQKDYFLSLAFFTEISGKKTCSTEMIDHTVFMTN